MNRKKIENQQKAYWQTKLEEDKDLTYAVGSESIAHKNLRYQQISKLFGNDVNFSLLDVGAGVADYYSYLKQYFPDRKINYSALEITEEFSQIARNKYPEIKIQSSSILDSEDSIEVNDYVVLSGIFHQLGEASISEWETYLEEMIVKSFALCKKGMAFNVLSNFVDYKKSGNYYCDLVDLQQFIVSKLSRFFTVNHAYPLFEATFYVYKREFIADHYPQIEFQKYLK
mgnify:CR=1 FL=1